MAEMAVTPIEEHRLLLELVGIPFTCNVPGLSLASTRISLN